jgi:Phospholipase_D-nuclease N-terminal
MPQSRSHLLQELRIIPKGWMIASGIGLAAIEVLFLVYIPMWCHHRDLPPEPWWALLGVVSALLMAATILLIGYIYADSKRRSMNAILWTLLVILIPKPIGFIAYFLLRKPLLEPCPNCRLPVGADFAYCPKCGYAIMPSCSNCGRATRRDYICCPYCGKPLSVSATP